MAAGNRPGATAMASLLRGLEQLLETPSTSDFIIACGSEDWKVHKAVLFMHSSVLWKMCSNSNFKECVEGRAHLKDDDPKAVELMIRYMYFLDYPDQKLHVHVSVYLLADKYDIEDLKTAALNKFKRCLKDQYSGEDFRNAIDTAYEYETATPQVRVAIVDFLRAHPGLLHGDGGATLMAIIRQIPAFAAEVVEGFAEEMLYGGRESRIYRQNVSQGSSPNSPRAAAFGTSRARAPVPRHGGQGGFASSGTTHT